MPTATRATIDAGEFALSAEGVDRAEELAAHTFEHLIAMTEVARLDTTVTAMFMLSEVLSGLEVYAGLSAADAVNQVQHLAAERVAALRLDATGPTAAASAPRITAPARGQQTLH